MAELPTELSSDEDSSTSESSSSSSSFPRQRKSHEVSRSHRSRRSHAKKGKKKKKKRKHKKSSRKFDSDSDYVSPKREQESEQHSSTSKLAVKVFRKHYSDLVTMVKSDLVTLSAKLYSKNMISEEVHSHMIDTTSTDTKLKASRLLTCIGDGIEVKHVKLIEFIKILKEIQFFEDLAEKMMGDTEEISMLCVSDQTPKLSKAFLRYKKYLTSYYSNQSIVDDKLSIAPCSDFISLSLVLKDRSRTTAAPDDTATHSRANQIYSPIGIDDIFTPDSQFVLVEGTPGIGKSTLCWELCKQWDNLKSLERFKLVLLLKLRDSHVQNATKLDDIFYHRDPQLCQSVVSKVFECEGEGVLLIFDGFNELPTTVVNDKRSLVMELITGTCLPCATRLVTSRPSTLFCFPQKRKSVEIHGFNDACKDQFIQMAFKSEPKLLSHFKRFVVTNPIIKSLMYIPVNCAIIAMVYKDLRKDRKLVPKTMTQLYTILILVLMKRYMIESGKWDKDHKIPENIQSLPVPVRMDFIRICLLAYHGLLGNRVQLVFTESDVGENFQTLGLLTKEKEMYVCEGARISYSFLHLSIQEYLAAYYVSQCRNRPQILQIIAKIFTESIVKPLYNAFGRFISGLLGGSVILAYLYFWKELASNKGIDWDGNYLSQCLYEAQESIDSTVVCKLCPTIYLRNSLDLHVFAHCLTHTNFTWIVTLLTSANELVLNLKQSDTVLGCIESLAVDAYMLLEVEKLCNVMSSNERPIQEIIIVTICRSNIHTLANVLPSLHKCRSISFCMDEVCQQDYLLFQQLQKCDKVENFSLRCMGCTKKGAQELCKIISNLKKIVLLYSNHALVNLDADSRTVIAFDLYPAAEAALLSTKVQFLCTNFPIMAQKIPTFKLMFGLDIHNSHFKSSLNAFGISDPVCIIELQRVLQCLYYLCQTQPASAPRLIIVQGIFHFSTVFLFRDFIILVNWLLNHFNVGISKIEFPSGSWVDCYTRKVLMHSLRRDTNLPPSSLRSRSLCDMVLQSSASLMPFSESNLVRGKQLSQSCPDFIEMQAFHKIHPILSTALGIKSPDSFIASYMQYIM